MNAFFRHGTPVALGLALLGCEPKVDDPGFSKGSLNVSRYLAIGDSYTANVTNQGLYQAGQEQSYAAIIATQLSRVEGSATFQQPFLPGEGTGHFQFRQLGAGGQPEFDFVKPTAYSAADFYSMAPCPYADSLFYLPHASTATDQLNNLGVPLLRYPDLRTQNLGNRSAAGPVNPYLERLLPPNDTSSYQTVAVANKPTFFTIWLGTDEVLGYALAGGKRTSSCDLPTRTDIDNNLPKQLESLLNALEANGGKGIVGDVPRVLDFPYFKQVNTGKLIESARTAMQDPAATLYITQSTGVIRTINVGKDIILPGALAKMGTGTSPADFYGYSAAAPIEKDLVLDLNEVNRITTAVSAYNDNIRKIMRKRLNTTIEPAAQINVMLTGVQTSGLVAGGVQYTNKDFSGGIFSLDGHHFSQRGNALIANTFIDKANQIYDANIPRVDPNAFPTSLKP